MVIHNGIDVQRFLLPASVETADRLKALKKSLGIPEDAKVAIMIGRLHPVKNHVKLLRSAATLLDFWEELHIVFIGEGELREDLFKMTNQLGLNDCVHFLGLRQDISDLLGLSDVFVLCSETEGLPLSLFEAMAAGVPVLITNSANRAGLIKVMWSSKNGHPVKQL